jgi:hypothetical protein
VNVIAGRPITVSGRSNPNATILLYDNGAPITTPLPILADGSGYWNTTLTYALVGSTHAITAKQIDFTSTFTSTSASSAATISVFAQPAAPVVTGATTPSATNSTTPVTLSGTGVNGYGIQIFDNGVAIASAGLTWTLTTWRVTIDLGPGTHNLTATQTRVVGVTSVQSTTPYTVTVVVPPPVAPSVTGPTNVIGGTVFRLTGRGTPGNTINLSDGGAPILGLGTIRVDFAGNWFVELTFAAGSTHTLTATQTSPTSGFTSLVSLSITLKAWGPPVIVGNSRILNFVTLTGTAAPNQQVTIYDAGVAVGTATASSTGAWSFTKSFASGAHSFTTTLTLNGVTSGSSNLMLVTVPAGYR